MIDVTQMLIKHEGLRNFVYNDSIGIPTIGVGRNLKSRGITNAEAMYLLNNDIADFTKQLRDRFYWFDSIHTDAQAVMLDMCFNMGLAGLLTFTNTLEHIKNEDYKEAAKDMLNSKWAVQVGTRSLELSDILKNI